MPTGNIYFHEFVTLLTIGAVGALASVGAVNGANWLSAQPLPPHLRDQMYDFFRSLGADV